jgi:hypothetical protein
LTYDKILEISEMEVKITMINMLRVLMKKLTNARTDE